LLKPVEIPNGPAEILSMDLVTGIRNSDMKYVLVCIDKFTKRVNYIGFKKTPTSKIILTKLEKTNFSKFGYPQVIISDRGLQFKGEVWRKMLATLQILARLTTTAHPQSDGQSERAIQNLIH
jgi:Integrase core domain